MLGLWYTSVNVGALFRTLLFGSPLEFQASMASEVRVVLGLLAGIALFDFLCIASKARVVLGLLAGIALFDLLYVSIFYGYFDHRSMASEAAVVLGLLAGIALFDFLCVSISYGFNMSSILSATFMII
ncbi:hypothetical protein T484DRAFT_1801032, partial [Baffinella frigidus]